MDYHVMINNCLFVSLFIHQVYVGIFKVLFICYEFITLVNLSNYYWLTFFLLV